MDQLNVIAWQGRAESATGLVSDQTAAQMAATIGAPRGPVPQTGDVLPPLWHWTGFPVLSHMDELSDDGHPRLGSFLPPIRQARRMWAGGSLRFHAPLRVGEPLERRSTVREIVEKDGSGGKMVFVTVDHAIFGTRGLAIEERQDIVYLPMPERYAPPAKRPVPETARLLARRGMSEALLFRYSALTFNAHRIHYDLPYARDVEHYPGLVVHGPLQATLLMQAAIAHAGRPPEDFHYRGVHPMFAGTDLEVFAVEEDGTLSLCTAQDGHQGMTATAIWGSTV